MANSDIQLDDQGWIDLVRGFEKGLNTMLSCLVPRLGIHVTRTTLREKAIPCNTDEGFLIGDLLRILGDWYVESDACDFFSASPQEIRFPVVLSVTNGNRNRFLLAAGMDNDNVELINSDNTTRHVPVELLRSYYDESAFMFSITREYREHRYKDKHRTENKEVNDYRDGVKEIRHFLTDEECDDLLDLAKGRYQRSSVVLHGEGEGRTYSDARTSCTVVLDKSNNLLARIRMHAATLCDVEVNRVENVQCARYQIGEEFGLHQDAFESTEEGCNRAYTVLVYLNDNFKGGGTWFSELDLSVLPEKGKALLFKNLDQQGLPEPLSRHAGMPVIHGVKYVCNLWVRDHAWRNIT